MNELTVFQIILVCLSVLLFILFIFYILGTIDSKGSIIQTTVFKREEYKKNLEAESNENTNANNNQNTNASNEAQKAVIQEANFFYFLPEASLLIKATATVTVLKSADDNTILSSKLLQLKLDTKVNIDADTKQLLLINHNRFAFANDELKWSVNEKGLLENVSVISEDRIGNIVAQLGNLPIEAGKMQLMKVEKDDIFSDISIVNEKHIIETRIFTNEFLILSSELNKKTFERQWHINIDGLRQSGSNDYVNASFNCDFGKELEKKDLDADSKIEGVVTRPLIKRKMSVKVGGSDSSLEYEITVPDISTSIAVPIKRTPFIKQTTTPKFSSGLLIENYINRPSTFEAFISIPIQVAKAIASIPSALFNFKISHIRHDTNLLNAQMDLVKAQIAANKVNQETKNENPSPRSDTQTKLLELLAKNKTAEDTSQATIVPQLGKAPSTDDEISRFAEHTKIKMIAFESVQANLDPPPSSFSWLAKLKTWKWNDYENIKKPYCVPVAAAHLITTWSANTSIPRVPTQENIVSAYTSLIKDGSNDVKKGGCSIRKMLLYWEGQTLGGDRLKLYSPLKAKDVDSLKKAVYYYGGCMIGLQMPKAVKNIQETTSWDPPKDCDFTGDWAVNSWDGHAVIVVGVNNDVFEVVSWDRVIPMSSRFYTAYNDEAYVLLSMDWFKDDNTCPVGAQFTNGFLQSQIDKF